MNDAVADARAAATRAIEAHGLQVTELIITATFQYPGDEHFDYAMASSAQEPPERVRMMLRESLLASADELGE